METERQVYETTIRQLQHLLQAQTSLRKAAEQQALLARAELERLAEALCPEEVDRFRQERPEGLSLLSPAQVADLVLRSARARGLRTASNEQKPSLQQWEQTRDRLNRLQAELEAALDRAARAEAEAASLRAQLAARKHATSPPPPPMPDPARRDLLRAAADLLEAAGYAVERFPSPLFLPDGRAFVPDLLITIQERNLPVEVEDFSRPPDEQADRWEAMYRLGDGHLCFVAPDARTLDRIRSEVFFWIEARPLTLWIADLEQSRGKRGHKVWRVRRTLKGE